MRSGNAKPVFPDGIRLTGELHRSLPGELVAMVVGREVEPITIGCSGMGVFRLVCRGAEPLYLKTASAATLDALRAEGERLAWLAGKLPAPCLLYVGEEEERGWLLTSALVGVNASDQVHRSDPARLVAALAEGLRMIHAVPIDDCPFDHTSGSEMLRARRRMEQGLVDENDFDSGRRGRSAGELYDELLNSRPDSEDLVFTHGDYSLPNVIIRDGEVSGFVDLGGAGCGNRYRDLAIAARSLAFNHGAALVPAFFAAYGIEQVDESAIVFHTLLDEFF